MRRETDPDISGMIPSKFSGETLVFVSLSWLRYGRKKIHDLFTKLEKWAFG